MLPSCSALRSGLALSVAFSATTMPGLAQVRPDPYYYSLHLLDLAIRPTAQDGVELIAAPSLSSREGSHRTSVLWLGFDPDSVVTWLNLAGVAPQTAPPRDSPDGIQLSPPLPALHGHGTVSVGRSHKHGRLTGSRWLVLADSTVAWRLELTAQEADSLLRLVLVATAQAQFVPEHLAAVDPDTVDTPASIAYQPQPTSLGRIGRVLVRYIVGTDGRPEIDSFEALLASDTTFVTGARRVIAASRFHPAQRRGQPLRQMVIECMVWPR